MNASDFGGMTDEEIELKAARQTLGEAKKTAMGFLGKAVGLYKRASKGDPSPTLVGKAIAYLSSFQELAPVLGIRKDGYHKIVHGLWESLGKLMTEVEENSRKTIIEHRRDPEGIALEQKRLELREKTAQIKIEDNRPAVPEMSTLKAAQFEQPTDEGVIKEVIDWMVHSQLGYEKTEAEKRARLVYKPGIPVEELISAACRIAR